MKQLTLMLAFVAFASFAHAQVQPYTPFYLNNVEWTMERVYPTIGPGDNTDYWRLYTTTDTIINGLTYRQVAIEQLCRLLYSNQQLTVINTFANNNYAIGALREADKKIYFYKYAVSAGLETSLTTVADEQEHLIYDFNLEVEDTLFCSNGQFTVIKEVLPPTQGLNALKVSPRSVYLYPYETGVWTEGIGSSYGLFGSFDSYLRQIICYQVNNVPTIYSSQCTPCAAYVNTSEAAETVSEVTAFPNPTTGLVRFQSSQGNPILGVQLWGLDGRQLYQTAWDEGQASVEVTLPPMTENQPVLAQINLTNGVQSLWVYKLVH